MIECTLCPNLCVLDTGETGRCRARMNVGGKLFSLVYGKPCAVHVDPIEKKPMFHFLPGTTAFSIATAGCCLQCRYCQNWQISQADPAETQHYDLPPAAVVDEAVKAGCRSIAYTYTDPIIFFEYMLDTAVIARERGLKNILVTCGYINPEPLAEMTPFIDGANIDLKGFSEEYYRDVCGGKLQPVLDCIQYMYRHGVIVELTNLVVPTLNDSIDDMRRMCTWVKTEVGAAVPMHFSRFYPQYKLAHVPPTPVETLVAARDCARDVGLQYVYTGNVDDPAGEVTACPACRAVLVERRGYRVMANRIVAGGCPQCGTRVYGYFV